jgi:hypothetical protein
MIWAPRAPPPLESRAANIRRSDGPLRDGRDQRARWRAHPPECPREVPSTRWVGATATVSDSSPSAVGCGEGDPRKRSPTRAANPSSWNAAVRSSDSAAGNTAPTPGTRGGSTWVAETRRRLRHAGNSSDSLTQDSPLGNHPAATSKATPKAASASLPKWPSGSARATSAPRPTELTPGAEPSP